MVAFTVNEKCTGCLACVQNCPTGALASRDAEGKRVISHNLSRCARCLTCFRVCPEQAVEFGRLLEGSWEEVAAFNLVLCRVCGAPLRTERQGEKLTTAAGAHTGDFCPRHRSRAQAGALRLDLPRRAR